jgi:murein DD-endopeptidase MepM/ murein hydrolase activator NlpD
MLVVGFVGAISGDSPRPSKTPTEPSADSVVSTATDPDTALNRLIRPYSTQRIVSLDENETFTFTLRSGETRATRLVSVTEHRDSVVDLMRRAEVRLEIDGRPRNFVCEPYTMPTEADGLRVLVDSTADWGNVPKRVQLSVWDAADEIVDTKRFVFPIKDFRLFSHGMQAYNEPVHLGAGDDDPAGQRFYHDYGLDMAGFEGGNEVLSAVEGDVVYFWPSRDDPCSVLVQDINGFVWEHAHLKSFEPDIVVGKHVTSGTKLGAMGRTGPSGDLVHLHLGTYCRLQDVESISGQADQPNRRLNLYPWLVAAYQAQHPKGLAAVARPHHLALTAEKVVFDSSHSLAWGGAKIVERRWVFPDGQTVTQATAEKTFDKPGAYVAELWVKDDQGNEDVDFCQVKVFSKDHPEQRMPHLYMSCFPTQDVHAGQSVRFRIYPQGEVDRPIAVEFDDGLKIADYEPNREVQHAFNTPGIHIITARCQADGNEITMKQKIVVQNAK